ncbi:hypothetical protein AB0I89_26800 [Micromonospora sp. NPDC049801]|uniref:hypothetical protein n=1 Tax=unclassified Micromonospora TaxID=2617518 RepID=UPI0033EEEA5D
MQIDPEGISAAGTTMRSLADGFADKLTAFQARLASIGPAFGDDETGSLLGVAYDEAAAYVFESLLEALDEVGFAGDDLTGMARAHEANEADTGDLFRVLLKRMEG